MFGQQSNEDDDQQQNGQAQPVGNGALSDVSQSPAAPPADNQFTPPKPAYDSVFDDGQTTDASLSSADEPVTSAPAPVTSAPLSSAPVAPTETDDDLLDIKKQALEHLSPLVGQLEQSPEEKFHTTMRIIQASDNHALVKDAFEAAQQITDDKVRAQALLDIINEINYFTKQDDAEQPQA
ncbi:hypothetical protein BH23PAT2_BH23PAT2_01280 [soil metagenome]